MVSPARVSTVTVFGVSGSSTISGIATSRVPAAEVLRGLTLTRLS